MEFNKGFGNRDRPINCKLDCESFHSSWNSQRIVTLVVITTRMKNKRSLKSLDQRKRQSKRRIRLDKIK